MKKECIYTRAHLHRYLRGHLFKPQQMRIERHLASCVVCRSEFDSLRRIGETRRIIRDITPPESVAERVKEGLSGLSGIKKLLFRPLWVAAIIGAVAIAYVYVITPLLHDPDLEKLDAGTPSPPAVTAEPALQTSPAVSPVTEPKRPAPVAAASKTDPLVVTITVEKENEKASVQMINDAMKEHALLTAMRFSESVREISGSLTPDDLYTFFNRIQGAGKITYKRARLASVGRGEMLPFVMKLQAVAAPARQPAEQPAAKPADAAGEGQGEKAATDPARRAEPAPPEQ